MTSIIKVQNIQYTDGDAALTIADGGGVTAASTLSAKGGAVFNEDSADVDFRVESNSNTHMLFVDGGNDTVGIGISNPADYTEHSDDLVVGGTTGNRGITIIGAANGYSNISLNRSTNTTTTPNGAVEYNHTDNQMYIKANGNHCLQLNSDGSVNKPNQPLWSAKRASTRMKTSNGFTMTNNQIIPFSNYENVGSHVASNIFTAPVTGKYLCNVWGVSYSATSTWVALYVYANSTIKATAYNDIHNSWQNISSTIILGVSANDTIKFHIQAGHADATWHEGEYGGCSVSLIT